MVLSEVVPIRENLSRPVPTGGLPTFDGRSPGTPESAWQHARLADAAPLDMDGVDRLLVVSAHPDDETLGAAGLIRTLAGRGAEVTVLVASDGEGSHPDSTTHSPARIGHRRRREMRSALDHLAPAAEIRWLGLPDGSLTDRLAELVDAVRPAVVEAGGSGTGTSPDLSRPGRRTLIAAPWSDDGHPDHEAVARAVGKAAEGTGARIVEFPVWAWHWAAPADPRLDRSRLAVLHLDEPRIAVKRLAIAEHHSQIEAIGPGPGDRPVLTADFLEHFHRSYEVFLPVRPSLDRDYFDRLYAGSGDPWRLGAHWYESRKRDLTIAALTRPRFRSAFEPGCATGLLTERLADRCDWLLAGDVSVAAVETARHRVAGRRHVEVERLAVPSDWPDDERFDLVVLSELGYYCGRADLSRLIARAAGSLAPDGILLACHWRHRAPDYPLTGDQVHAALVAESGLALAVSHLEEDFRLDVFTTPGAPSVAAAEGILG